ncbi:MAG: lipoprotein B transmembrane [Piscirickettsiaceae bacterium]|nr:MAG: lipoprotein B transmembrane [Piscirickettsiaceae bacterium]PCI71336.1 MAG: lipoprotein B transmembrane [Piscirickettsiaceae bacterium]
MLKSQTNRRFNQVAQVVLLFCLMLSVSSCGFKLRGAVDLPADMQKILVVGSVSSDLVQDLKDSLQYSAQVVSSLSEADAVLSIIRETSESRTLSVDSNGKIREAELQYSVIFDLKRPNGEVLLKQDTLLLVRDYINDENDVIGRSNESAVITRDLKRDAAQQILRRLQALRQK